MREGIDCKGKKWKEKIKTSPRALDLRDTRFGRLLPLFRVDCENINGTFWLCQCSCGNQIVVERHNLSAKNVQSCGCLKQDKQQLLFKTIEADLVGKTFGYLTVIKYDGLCQMEKDSKPYQYCTCQCKCGNTKQIRVNHLKNNATLSCGCLYKEQTHNKKNLIGQKFGLLTVIAANGVNKHQLQLWLCQCDCGGTKIVSTNDLTSQKVRSCGCIKHSLGETLIKKCLSENNIPFKTEVTFNDLISSKGGHPRYDFVIYNNFGEIKRLIEFDGEQHNSPKDFFGGQESFEQLQSNDILKNQYAKTHNIPLIRIPYTERDNISIDMLLGDKYLI